MLSETMCERIWQPKDEKEALHSRRKHGWSKSCKGRRMGGSGGWPRRRNPLRQHHQRHPHQHLHHHHHHHHHPRQMSLRPVNVKGNRVKGMQAPKNTNQFLMHEKYQMLHMRSDSVGSDSGSDTDMELTDMDSYLCVLENARGALLDSPNPHGSAAPPGPIVVLHQDSLHLHKDSLHVQADSLRLQEDSMPYFPSEDDLVQSQNFMQKDFVEFYDILMT